MTTGDKGTVKPIILQEMGGGHLHVITYKGSSVIVMKFRNVKRGTTSSCLNRCSTVIK